MSQQTIFVISTTEPMADGTTTAATHVYPSSPPQVTLPTNISNPLLSSHTAYGALGYQTPLPTVSASLPGAYQYGPSSASMATPLPSTVHVIHHTLPASDLTLGLLLQQLIQQQQQQATTHFLSVDPRGVLAPGTATPLDSTAPPPNNNAATLAPVNNNSSDSSSTSSFGTSTTTPVITVAGTRLVPLPAVPPQSAAAASRQPATLPREPYDLRFSSSKQKRSTKPIDIPQPAPGLTECLQIVVNYLAPEITDVGLRQLFSRYDGCVAVRVAIDPSTGRSRGYGFVWYSSQAAAIHVITEASGRVLLGKRVVVRFADPQQPVPEAAARDDPQLE